MLDPFAEFAVALRQFGGARREFLGQRGLTCQCRVTLCPQRRDDGSEGRLCVSSGGAVIRFPPSRQSSPP